MTLLTVLDADEAVQATEMRRLARMSCLMLELAVDLCLTEAEIDETVRGHADQIKNLKRHDPDLWNRLKTFTVGKRAALSRSELEAG